jgi:hypothetical protein
MLCAFVISSMRATFPVYLILLDLISRTIFGEVCTLWSSLCCLVHPPGTSSSLVYTFQICHPVCSLFQVAVFLEGFSSKCCISAFPLLQLHVILS